ncbi:type IX secretion system outer membrane channel protein PorV [Balneolales bacterium ANBcel1]|nr:type IX secretion system outer membrane channel protein PorV [Balneolales bacterium ANBcel1]
MFNLKNYLYTLVLSVLLLFSAAASHAQVGVTAVPFLQIEPDSRTAGMGNSGVAIADNATAIYWNPAGLAFQEGHEVSLTHADWLPDFNVDMFYDYLAGKYYIEGIGTIGAHITYLNLGEQERRGEDGQYLGDFSSYEVAGGFSYGFKLTDNLALGTGIRFIFSNLVPSGTMVSEQEARNGTSIGVDIAALYRTNPFTVLDREAQFSAGANLSNFGPRIQYTDEAQKDPLPTLLRVGWAYKMNLDQNGFNTITISNDYSKLMARRGMSPFEALYNSWGSLTHQESEGNNVTVPLSEQIMIGTGIEYWYDNLFALRAGYFYESPNNGAREFLTFGAGLRYNIFGVDFSYIYTIEEDHPLANTLRFTASLHF